MTFALVVAALLSLWVLARFYGDTTGVCLQCGGRGAHRDGCPNERGPR